MGFRLFLSLSMVFISGWFAYKSIKSGRLEHFGYSFTRADNPTGFWSSVAGWCFLCALFTYRLIKLLAEVSAEY